MPREIEIPATVTLEDICTVEEVVGHAVRISVGRVDQDGKFIVPQQFSRYEIVGADFDDLMASSPEWAPNKPAGTYRNEDLWRFIDIIRARGDAQ